MATRATRSKQRAADVAKASPARSTRSGGRSSSPAAHGIGLRSASPATPRSASQTNNTKSPPTARNRGRGRATNKAATTTKAESPKSKSSKAAPSAAANKTRRGRGRNSRVKSAAALADQNEEDLADDATNIDEGKVEDVSGVSADSAVEENDVPVVEVNNEHTKADISYNVSESNDLEADPLTFSMRSTASSEGQSNAAAAIAEIANHLAASSADQWPANEDMPMTLTEENMKTLESVLSSEEGLKLLAEQQDADDIIDDKIIQVGFN